MLHYDSAFYENSVEKSNKYYYLILHNLFCWFTHKKQSKFTDKTGISVFSKLYFKIALDNYELTMI